MNNQFILHTTSWNSLVKKAAEAEAPPAPMPKPGDVQGKPVSPQAPLPPSGPKGEPQTQLHEQAEIEEAQSILTRLQKLLEDEVKEGDVKGSKALLDAVSNITKFIEIQKDQLGYDEPSTQVQQPALAPAPAPTPSPVMAKRR